MISSILATGTRTNFEHIGIVDGAEYRIYGEPPGCIEGISHCVRGIFVAVSTNSHGPLKEWKFPGECKVDSLLVEAAGGSELLAKLLASRGIASADEARSFLDPSQYTPTSPMSLPDMPRAIVRITQAIEQQERITIYGDYDVDGVTATSVMLSVLRRLGADVDYYIPNRAEGYGLNLKAVSILASKHRTKLLISCDCGISNFSEINFGKSLGVDTIVVDHHTMPEVLPPAAAILHPKQLSEEHPLYHLPGVGVAYKLCEALLTDRGLDAEVASLLDFVTLGMIADMVPLTRENRYLVQMGMPALVNSPRAGIKALLNQVTGREGTDLVGFALAPRINAVGRLADATLAVELMTTDDDETAQRLARQLEMENTRRQELCEKIFFEADQKAAAALRGVKDKAIAIFAPGWHHGVVGIVASRLVDKYHCPVFIGGLDESEGIVKGSARGVSGIDLYEVLKSSEHLAIKFGGHKMAAGFTVEADKAEIFCRSIVDTCNRMLSNQELQPTLDIDLVVTASDLTMDLARILARLAPFGMSNKKPVLCLSGLSCLSTRALGKEGKHHRLIVASKESGSQFECVLWNSRGRLPDPEQVVDLAFMPEINVYNGQERLQLVVADWRDPRQKRTPVPSSETAVAPGIKPAAPSSQGKAALCSSSETAEAAAVKPAAPSGALTAAPSASGEVAEVTLQSSASGASAQFVRSLLFKDLRGHGLPESLLQGASRKLGVGLAVFGESCTRLPDIDFADRHGLAQRSHLLIWQYPPSIQVFKSLLEKNSVQTVYLVGGAALEPEDGGGFLKRLLGLVRFAVNRKEGQARPEKIASAMGTNKMSIALGLTILKKVNLIDWFAEDGCLYLDLIGQPTGSPEQLPEFRQLSNSLKEISEFRKWCSESPFNEIQLALAPNSIRVVNRGETEGDSLGSANESSGGLNRQHERASQLPSN